jgi:hypothetical protein
LSSQETNEGTADNGDERKDEPFVVTDNLVIFLLILFTLMISAWWLLNMYMGRWI